MSTSSAEPILNTRDYRGVFVDTKKSALMPRINALFAYSFWLYMLIFKVSTETTPPLPLISYLTKAVPVLPSLPGPSVT